MVSFNPEFRQVPSGTHNFKPISSENINPNIKSGLSSPIMKTPNYIKI